MWLRASGMPLGMMNFSLDRPSGMRLGSLWRWAFDDDSLAVWQFLCIKVRFDIG